MRINIVIDGKLMEQALEASGLTTKTEVVELAFKLLVCRSNLEAVRKLRGKLNWEGDLDEIRDGN